MAVSGSRRRWVPLLILALGLASTAGACLQLKRVQHQRERERYTRAVQQTRSAIAQRIETYVTILRTTSGLFYASEDVTRSEFSRYFEQTRLTSAYPGIQGIGFSARSPDGSTAALQAMLAQAYPEKNIQLRDAGEPPEHHAIVYLEPLDAANERALGFNMFSEGTRRRAMEEARDSGEPRASGLVTLVQEPKTNFQRGFLIYMPIYGPKGDPGMIESRRRELRGFVYAAFRVGDLMGAVFAEGEPPVEYVLFDASSVDTDGLVYASPSYADHREAPAGLDAVAEVMVAGRRWQATFVPGDYFENARPADIIPLVSIAGVLISLLLWGIASVQAYSADRADAAARALAHSKKELEESEARKGAILASAIDAIITMDERGRVLEWNPAADRLFRWRAEDVAGKTLDGLVSHQTPGLDMLTLIAAQGRRYETVVQRADGTTFPAEVSVCRVGSSEPARFTGFIRDITERARAEHHRQLMTRELDHRVKNNLSTVMAILGESARRADSKDRLVQSVAGRLRALASLHEMLAVRKWQGADVRELVERTLAPHRGRHGSADRVQISGDAVQVPGKIASALCMALHELATNASKYGALSVADGRVEVAWTVRQTSDAAPGASTGSLVIDWREYNGPPVHAPSQRGFGSELIEGGIAFETGGRTELWFEPTGVRCTITIPLPAPGVPETDSHPRWESRAAP